MTEQQGNTEKGQPETPVARLIPNPNRERMVPLDYPVEFNGAIITEIRVHRCSGKEVQDFMAKLQSSAQWLVPPVIDCLPEVWDVLDADDQSRIEKEADDFLPQRLREIFASLLSNGEASSGS